MANGGSCNRLQLCCHFHGPDDLGSACVGRSFAVPQRVRLGVFSPSVLLGVAAESGLLDRAGLVIEEVPATSSAQQFSALLAGDLDAAFTSPDNVLAYRNPAANPLGRAGDVRILAAVDRGLGLSLFTAPRFTALRGGVLGVDVPASGFAFVAYELLAQLGLRAGQDYEVSPCGTTPHRATALITGGCTMTVLNAGNDLIAEAAGCVRLSRATSLGSYLGTVLTATAARIETDGARLQALARVIVTTAHAICAGRLRALTAGVAASRLGLDEVAVQRHLRTLADPAEGLVPDGRVDQPSLATLRRLRDRHGAGGPGLASLIAPGSGLVDERFLPQPTP
jgi:ABC-type nitrate/sulfonate/bicarbonate transport system substrate-binding protein